MQSAHTDQDIEAACRQVARDLGLQALTRDAVQAVLITSALARGRGQVGADRGLVGRVVKRVRQALEAEMLSNVVADAKAEAFMPELPAGLTRIIEEQAVAITRSCRVALADVVRGAEAGARARVQLVETEAEGAITQLRHQLEAADREGQSLGAHLEASEEALSTRTAELQLVSAAFAEERAALAALQHDSRVQLAALAEDLRRAHEARSAADGHRRVAETERANLESALESAQWEGERVAADLTASRHEVGRMVGEVERTSAKLADQSCALTTLEVDSRRQIAALTDDLRRAHDGRSEADIQRRAAEAKGAALEIELAGLRERHLHLERERDRSQVAANPRER
jgi:chromosome segregation ATPase